jgi:hypothetical protein
MPIRVGDDRLFKVGSRGWGMDRDQFFASQVHVYIRSLDDTRVWVF